jgi:PTH1 family peptidyl-tRNA hydrolase
MIVGLGNPGKKYAHTKHNVGFLVLDQLAAKLGVTISKLEFEAATASTFVDGQKVLLVEPQTYMNDSGRAVGPLMNYYQVGTDELIVVQDDLDMPLGKLRLRAKGSAGGHNGLKSIIASIGSSDFARVKIGTDHPQKQTVVDWVLTPFSKDDQPLINGAMDQAVALLEDRIAGVAVPDLMNKYNG